MHVFRDMKDRQWTVQVTTHTIAQARNRLGIDLLKVVESKELIEELATDPVKLVDVLYVVCEEDAEKHEVSDVEFGRSMGGDALGNGYTALMEALIDFFPNPRKRAILKDLWARVRKLEEAAIERVAMRLADPKLDEWLEKQINVKTQLPSEFGG